ncbi:hypothetical protein BDR07DRAFT_1464178 [Suillus spraguei]|nr:hypothetical protein BDR07DRAFT_1464178 [Suillus spraguei]
MTVLRCGRTLRQINKCPSPGADSDASDRNASKPAAAPAANPSPVPASVRPAALEVVAVALDVDPLDKVDVTMVVLGVVPVEVVGIPVEVVLDESALLKSDESEEMILLAIDDSEEMILLAIDDWEVKILCAIEDPEVKILCAMLLDLYTRANAMRLSSRLGPELYLS